MNKAMLMGLLLVLFVKSNWASTWYVATNGNDSASGTNWATAKATLQAGINVASNGDTVLVRAGTYSGTGNRDLQFTSKNIAFQSETGPMATIVDCGGVTRAVTFSGLSTNTSFSGFTIRNGYFNETGDWGAGGIVRINDTSAPLLSRCIIRECRVDCSYWTAGPGLITSVAPTTTLLRNLLVVSNVVNGGSYPGVGGRLISINWPDRRFVVENCTFARNTLSGNYPVVLPQSGIMRNVIVWNNQNAVTFTPTYSTNFNSIADTIAGMGFQNVDPGLNGDCTLNGNSPAINAGTNQAWMAGDVDLAGTNRVIDGIVDIGAYEFGYHRTGIVTYSGGQTGTIYVVSSSSVETNAVAMLFPGWYGVNVSEGTLVTMAAYRDSNGNGTQDYWEAEGCYTNNPILWSTAVSGINITLRDPDHDGDGLPGYREMLYGTSDSDIDSDGDGFDDLFEVTTLGLHPTNSDAVIVGYISTNQHVFGLYSSNTIGNLSLGQLMIGVSSGVVRVTADMDETDDLASGWTNNLPPLIWEHPATSNKAFYRVRAH